MINAPIRQHFFHDAHLFWVLFAFFIAVALPFKWHSIVLCACVFAMLASIQGVSIGFIFKSLALAFVLSISIWLLNVLFHNDASPDNAVMQANQTALKIWSLTWVALLSSQMVNLRDCITHALQRGYVSSTIAYAMMVGIGSVTLLQTEARRINLNAKLRGIKGLQKFSQWVPLLIFALRHSQRGAMSLRARGLTAHKAFYYDYQATRVQTIRLVVLIIALTVIVVLSEQFANGQQ